MDRPWAPALDPADDRDRVDPGWAARARGPRLGGSSIVDELVASEAVRPAANNAWNILTSLLRDGGLTLLGLGVIVLVAVWVVGPSRGAVGARQGLAPYLARPEIAYGVVGDSLPAPALVEPDRPDHQMAADGGGSASPRAGSRAAATPDGAGGARSAPADLSGAIRRRLRGVRGRADEEERVAALERLGRLREQGVLTDEEFAAEKAQLARR